MNPSCRGRCASAFSLIEMMIALIILGFGLLIVGAALPVGLTYNRESGDLVLGEAAIDYGFETIEQFIRRSDLYQSASTVYEPFIKVRPLLCGNVDASGLDLGATFDDTEITIGVWTTFTASPADGPDYWSPIQYPPVEPECYSRFPGLFRTFPTVTPDNAFTVAGYFSSPYWRTRIAKTSSPAYGNNKASKSVDGLIHWTAFYRRVSYSSLTPSASTSRGMAGEDSIYEFIMVATRRPSVNHRFARQDTAASGNPWMNPMPLPAYPTAVRGPVGNDRFAPVAWLVTFSNNNGATLPAYPALAPSPTVPSPPGPPDNRNLAVGAVEPATLEFRASAAVARLLPPGSIFIPARNDSGVSNAAAPMVPPRSIVGFVPHTPDSTPIYEVVERVPPRGGGANSNALWSIKVKNPGVYPYVQSPPQDPQQWPVWVIPPAVSGGRNQTFEGKSPIIGVERRVIRIPSQKL